jgi:nucleotide-binding universal stress UspA family protein
MFKRILFPVDGTNVNEKCIAVLKEFQKNFNSEIIIFNSQEITPTMYWLNESNSVNPQTIDLNELGKDIVEKVSSHFDNKYKVRTISRIGNVAHEILETAKSEDCDLIVMATHGMKATQRFLLGSITNKVVHHTDVPILVIR